MIGLFNSSYLGLGRVEATSLMPYGNANDIVMSLGDRIFPVVQNTPILGGIIGSDPTREMTPFLKIMQFKGFPAVINFPSPGFAYGQHRRNLERNNYGVQQELKTLRTDNHDALVLGLAMLEWENGGATLEQAAEYINRVSTKVKAVAPEMLIFVQGLPVQTPEDTQYIYDHTDAVGFIGINNMDYGTKPIQDTVAAFKSAKIHA